MGNIVAVVIGLMLSAIAGLGIALDISPLGMLRIIMNTAKRMIYRRKERR